ASWQPDGRDADFFDLRGAIDALLGDAGVEFEVRPTEHPSLHPGRAAEIRAGEDLLGYFGQLHPAIRDRLDLPAEEVLVAELDLELVSLRASYRRKYRGIRRFPAVGRQLTVALDPSIPSDRL